MTKINVKLTTMLLMIAFTTMSLTSLIGCDDSDTEAVLEPITFRLNWEDGSQFLGFYMADELGFYAEEGFDAEIMPRPDISEAQDEPKRLAAGEFDFSAGSQIYVTAQTNGVPVTAIASVYQFSPGTLFAMADSGIQTPKDLTGHSVAIKSDAWQSMVAALLQVVGLTLDDIKQVPSGFDMTPFYEGEVDVWAGYITNEVVSARLKGIDVVTLPLFEYGVQQISASIFASRESLGNDPERAIRFLRASLRGWEWAINDPAEAVDIMLQRFPEMVADRDFQLASFEASIPLLIPPGKHLGVIDCQNLINNELLRDLDSRDGLCATEILQKARIAD